MKTEHKLNSYMWFIVSLLPILIYLFTNFQTGNATDFSVFLNNFSFDFIADIFNNVFSNTGVLGLPAILVTYLSYIFSVELAHLIFDCLAFIIRFARKFLGGFLYE